MLRKIAISTAMKDETVIVLRGASLLDRLQKRLRSSSRLPPIPSTWVVLLVAVLLLHLQAPGLERLHASAFATMGDCASLLASATRLRSARSSLASLFSKSCATMQKARRVFRPGLLRTFCRLSLLR